MPLWYILQSRSFDQQALADLIIWVVALAIGITIHEFGHAYRADIAGDPTPRNAGRLSLYPWDHYDPIGTTLILVFGLGWAKPVPTNPAMFRRPRRDEMMVALWGPMANIIAAVVLAVPVRFGVLPDPYILPFTGIIRLQLILAVFNLIPVYPLDGSHILSALLPVDKARKLDQFYHRYGMIMIVVVIFLFGDVIWTIVMTAMRVLLGF